MIKANRSSSEQKPRAEPGGLFREPTEHRLHGTLLCIDKENIRCRHIHINNTSLRSPCMHLHLLEFPTVFSKQGPFKIQGSIIKRLGERRKTGYSSNLYQRFFVSHLYGFVRRSYAIFYGFPSDGFKSFCWTSATVLMDSE